MSRQFRVRLNGSAFVVLVESAAFQLVESAAFLDRESEGTPIAQCKTWILYFQSSSKRKVG